MLKGRRPNSIMSVMKSKTAMKRSKARALIQTYNAIVEFRGRLGSSPGTSAGPSLRAIAPVSDKDSAHRLE